MLLVVLMLGGMMQATFIQLEYVVNKEYYAKVLCENKEQPVLKCNGKCQLGKQLKQAEEQQEQSAPAPSSRIFISFVFILQDQIMSPFLESERIQYSNPTYLLSDGFKDTPFIPPIV